MKLLFVANALSLLSSSMAATVQKKQVENVWQVTGLTASAIPHSIENYFSFDIVTLPGPSETSCVGTEKSYQALGSLERTACESTSVQLEWAAQGDGAKLTVWRQASLGSWYHGSHVITPDQIEWANEKPNPIGRIQVYVGPRDFEINNVELGNGTTSSA